MTLNKRDLYLNKDALSLQQMCILHWVNTINVYFLEDERGKKNIF